MGEPARQFVPESSYLAFEAAATIKHEFLGSEIVAMAGASPRHNRIAVNLAYALENKFRQKKSTCLVFPSDQRVFLRRTDYYYPDLSIVCGKPEFSADRPLSLLNPRLIVEILSISTKAKDLGEKLAVYRSMPTVNQILYVNSWDERAVLWSRDDAKPRRWVLEEFDETKQEIDLWACGASFVLGEIYVGANDLPDEEGPSIFDAAQ